MKPDHAALWADTLRRAGHLNPPRILAAINASADSGLRAARYDKDGGRTSTIPCEDPETCHDGPDDHSHQLASDPTGNAAVNPKRDDTAKDRLDLGRAVNDFVMYADVVLDFVKGTNPTTWADVVSVAAQLMPGTVQAGLDVDDARRLPRAIQKAHEAVQAVERIHRAHSTREPSQDEQWWTSGLAPGDCCDWHMEIHDRYRRPRVSGTNICQACIDLALLLGQKPPRVLLEAEVDRDSKPKAWQQSLGRCMDELGVARATA